MTREEALAEADRMIEGIVLRIWYMRDNHTFRELNHDWECIEKSIREEFECGNSYGMMCATMGGKHYSKNEHAGKKSELDDFLARAKSWHTELMASQD